MPVFGREGSDHLRARYAGRLCEVGDADLAFDVRVKVIANNPTVRGAMRAWPLSGETLPRRSNNRRRKAAMRVSRFSNVSRSCDDTCSKFGVELTVIDDVAVKAPISTW
jgi:hypothetical protein